MTAAKAVQLLCAELVDLCVNTTRERRAVSGADSAVTLGVRCCSVRSVIPLISGRSVSDALDGQGAWRCADPGVRGRIGTVPVDLEADPVQAMGLCRAAHALADRRRARCHRCAGPVAEQVAGVDDRPCAHASGPQRRQALLAA
jgi:hypothetical protein